MKNFNLLHKSKLYNNVKSKNSMLSSDDSLMEALIDIIMIVLITALVFGLAYHPYFFGDELIAQRLAIQFDYSINEIFQGMNSYKPRLVFNGIQALLTGLHAPRLVYAALVTGYMVWINVLLYFVVRNLFGGGRVLAFLLIATALTSRYGTMVYFNYSDAMGELLSTALLLSVLMLTWLAWRELFNWGYAAGALFAAVLCILTLERYFAGLMAAGFAIAIAEWVGPSAKRRIPVVAWALSLSVLPLLLFASANTALGSLPMTTGTAGQEISLGWGTLWSTLTYFYNVLFGGNYGHEWFWGTYNHRHPVGKVMGWATATLTAIMVTVIVLRNGIEWKNRWMGIGLASVAGALIVIASFTGLERQEARYMIPVGIFVSITCIVMLKSVWRETVIAFFLMTNTMYLISGSFKSIAGIYASRAANSVASSLLGVKPNGANGIVVGNGDDHWSIGGGSAVYMGPRQGDTFSKVNLNSTVQIDPFVAGRKFDPAVYDFGLAFTGFGPNRTPRYRLVSASTAFILAGVSSGVDQLPASAVLGSAENWSYWSWANNLPDQVGGAVVLRAGTEGWRAIPVSNLDGNWLVYRARAIVSSPVRMRLQINWHSKQDNRFISAQINVVEVNETWQSYAQLLSVPPDAGIGYVFANLHDGAQGEVILESIDLRLSK